ncbi:MAG: DUF2244 domain-containing protein [Silicimonas sp.]|nr:DUF2244 domain-containing protein [Silicimonas sp.]
MPYEWTKSADKTSLSLWPHQSMTPEGFVWFIGATALLVSLPLLAVLGSPVVWVLLLFIALAIWGVWRAIMANRTARQIEEQLTLTGQSVVLSHQPPNGPALVWKANPSWVTVHLRPKGPVENYLTLRGGGREVELGAFLTPEERQGLYDDLKSRIR